MPASYAHYRFGKQVLPMLPADVRQSIQRFRRMYDMGLNGPDIFFYYLNPLSKNAGAELARSFHRQTGEAFFAQACTKADTEAARAYLYGLLAHYCLDSVCHPFVQQMVQIGEARHVLLESEFDRFLLEQDGLLPAHTQDRGKHLKLTRGECMTVAAFYPPATGGYVSASVRNMIFSLKFLANPNREKTEKILKRLHSSLPDQLIPEQELEDYVFMTGEMKELYDRAVRQFPDLLARLNAHRKTGEPLGEAFAATFG